MKVSGHPYPWCPATDMVFLDMDRLLSQYARHRPIARALHPGRDSWRCGILLPRRFSLKTTGRGAVQSGLLRLGRSLLCGPVGPAHGLDRARLRRLSRLALGIASHHALHPGPGALGDVTKCRRRNHLA